MTERDPFEFARLKARRIAREEGIPMVWGWQTNDDTGQLEPGYCPRAAVGPAFVHTPIGWAGLPENEENNRAD